MLALSRGWFGIVVGVAFWALAAFNYFIIKQHPEYKAAATKDSSEKENNSPEIPVAHVVV